MSSSVFRDGLDSNRHAQTSPVPSNDQTLLDSQRTDGSTQHHWSEVARVFIAQDTALQHHLDDQVADQEAKHLAALAQARSEHDRIRRNAEIARERVELEIERERKCRDADELAKLEAARQAQVRIEQDQAVRYRQQLEQQEQELRERALRQKQADEARARVEEGLRQKEHEAQVAAQAKEEELAKAREQARLAVANAEQERQSKLQADGVTASTSVSRPTQNEHASLVNGTKSFANLTQDSSLTRQPKSEREAQHQRYIQLHKDLKTMRTQVVAECKKIPELKNRIGDWRRQITKCLGQLTQDKARNRKPLIDIQATLKESLQFSQPGIDIASYLISVGSPESSTLVSGPFIYLLNIISKSVIAQFISECSGGAKAIDPVGVVAVTIFAMPAFQVAGRPMIDILLSKLHKTCPVLFGISGDEKTVPGRLRSGWWMDKEANRFIDAERHKERMTGLAAGFAALALRDFGKSRNDNPLPNTNYWLSLATIVNTPKEQIQPTHYIVLRALITGFVPRFIGFYGTAAMAALRCALVDFPEKAPAACKGAALQLTVARELLYNEIRLVI